jgi:hypothetical protein
MLQLLQIKMVSDVKSMQQLSLYLLRSFCPVAVLQLLQRSLEEFYGVQANFRGTATID